jgi:hypothetical protein
MWKNPRELNNELNNDGYKFLGWQNGWESIWLDKNGKVTDSQLEYVMFGGYDEKNHPEWHHCHKLGHNVRSVQHTASGSEVTYICDICKIYWKVDMSD